MVHEARCPELKLLYVSEINENKQRTYLTERYLFLNDFSINYCLVIRYNFITGRRRYGIVVLI